MYNIPLIFFNIVTLQYYCDLSWKATCTPPPTTLPLLPPPLPLQKWLTFCFVLNDAQCSETHVIIVFRISKNFFYQHIFIFSCWELKIDFSLVSEHQYLIVLALTDQLRDYSWNN